MIEQFRETPLDARDRSLELAAGFVDRTVNRAFWLVASQDLCQAVLHAHGAAGWPGGHIRVDERVRYRADLEFIPTELAQ